MTQKNTEADLWVRQIVMELKSEYEELIYPISMLQFKEESSVGPVEGFATDGITVYYHPEYIFDHRKRELKMQLLHIILHGLLGHFEMKDEYENREYRDFMMDMQVEYIFMQMQSESLYDRSRIWKKLDAYVQGDYSMSIYRRLCTEEISTSWFEYYYKLLQIDNHEIWDRGKEEKQREACMKLWRRIRKEVLEEGEERPLTENGMFRLLDTINGISGDRKKNEFQIGRKKRINYQELLEELIHMKEIEKENTESIDFMLYQYGLDLYEDVPLIEPAEEPAREGRDIIAIAVDVSGSCTSDEQMELFWGETYGCMQQLKEYYKGAEVVLFQCDDSIQQEQRFKLTDLEGIPKEVIVCGDGGTSFIPVFERLTELEQAGEKIDVLLYLTDGYGTYPKKEPDYPVYFIFERRQEDYSAIPDWINIVELK